MTPCQGVVADVEPFHKFGAHNRMVLRQHFRQSNVTQLGRSMGRPHGVQGHGAPRVVAGQDFADADMQFGSRSGMEAFQLPVVEVVGDGVECALDCAIHHVDCGRGARVPRKVGLQVEAQVVVDPEVQRGMDLPEFVILPRPSQTAG